MNLAAGRLARRPRTPDPCVVSAADDSYQLLPAFLMHVYLAWHTRIDGEDEDSKLLGVYSSQALAEAAVERLRTKPGFCRYPEDFEVVAYEVDRDEWTEGFGFDDPAVSDGL